MNKNDILIKEFSYNLPQQQIAEFPLANRDDSKLLVYKSGNIIDSWFKSIHDYLPNNSAIILNNTSVIEARILFTKPTGGVIEIFCLEPFVDQNIESSIYKTGTVQWKCLIGGASKWKSGQVLEKEILINNITVKLIAKYIDKIDDSSIIEFLWQPGSFSFSDVLHAAGSIPLPPYIKRKAVETDAERYQTVFAEHKGSVAAPTAALHFTKTVFDKLKEKSIDINYVTLHVGAATFKPVKTETIAEHQMHAEEFHITKQTLQNLINANEIIAVGTTSLRTLESLYWLGVKCHNDKEIDINDVALTQWEAYELESSLSYKQSLQCLLNYMNENSIEKLFCKTSLIIVPGYQFKSASALVTNFHQPQSTLLLLVSAFIGEDWKKVYDHALQHNYRFLSYGDSSLLFRKEV